MESSISKHMGLNVSNSYPYNPLNIKTALKDGQKQVYCMCYKISNCANWQRMPPKILPSHWIPQNASVQN